MFAPIRRITPLVFVSVLLHGADIHSDIEYARPAGVSLKLDVSVPEEPGLHPAIILVHGGAFVKGDRQSGVKSLFTTFANEGFVVFTIDYRLAPQYKYPAAVEDVEAAIRWIKANATRYKTDPNRLAILGQSAGGYLAAMAVARRKPGCDLSAVILFYPISDLLRTFDPKYTSQEMREDRSRFFGVFELSEKNKAFLREGSPYHHVRAGMPPYLLLHGTHDKRVDYPQSVAMCEKLVEMGNRCELITITNGGHGGWKDTGWKTKMLSWISSELRAKQDGRREPAR